MPEQNIKTIFGNDIWYHGHFRKLITVFGTVFNNIRIKRKNKEENIQQVLKVPISFSPKDALLSRVIQDPYLTKSNQQVLPRMGFSYSSLEFADNRQISQTRETQKLNGVSLAPAPYDVNFTLSILSKSNEDGLMILEQIIPFFQPVFTVRTDMLPENLGVEKDITIQLTGINYTEEIYGELSDSKLYTWDLTFNVMTYIYPPIRKPNIIKYVKTDLFNANDEENPEYLESVKVRIDPIDAEKEDDYKIIKDIDYDPEN